MTNASIKTYAEQLASILSTIEEKKLEAADIIESAKDAGINTKALRKVAKELIMDSEKLRKRYDDEEQIDMFRAEAGIFSLKGLESSEKAGAAHRSLGHRQVEQSARELDALLGSDLAGQHERLTKAVTAKIVRDREATP